MGRLQYLERLVLGRSAFEDAELEASTIVADNGQQYDSKSRPINPSTEARNQAMRNAQNAAYSLVGVVESKEASDRQQETSLKQRHQPSAKELEAETEDGKGLNNVLRLLNNVATRWPDSLIFKIQAGLFPLSVSFADAAIGELRTAAPHGAGAVFSLLFRGLPACLLYYASRGPLVVEPVIQGTGHLQQLLNKRLSWRKMKYIDATIFRAAVVLLYAITAAFLPLQCFYLLQSLGLAPARPLLPSWQTLLPGTASSVHPLLWAPSFGTSPLARLTSPGALLLLKATLDDRQEDILTTAQCYSTRERVFKWLGWSLGNKGQNIKPAGPNQVALQAPRDIETRYRATQLAHLCPEFLAGRMRFFSARLWMLPLESLILRAIVQNFSHSDWVTPTATATASSHGFLPFGGGPLSVFRVLGFSWPAFREAGKYMSKLGLGLAFKAFVEIAVCWASYRFCRWRGMSKHHWG